MDNNFITRSAQTLVQSITDKIRSHIILAIQETLGQNNAIKITSAEVTVQGLSPVGRQIIIKTIIDVYPKDESP